MYKSFPIRRGDIVYADLDPVIGSEQGGIRPVLVIQNDVGNIKSPTIIVAAITTSKTKSMLPTHYPIDCDSLKEPSMLLFEQIRTIDKSRIKRKIGRIDDETLHNINDVISISLGLKKCPYNIMDGYHEANEKPVILLEEEDFYE